MTGFDAANFFKQNKQLTGKNQDSVPPNNASGHLFLLTNVRLVSQSDFWVVSTLSQISWFFPTISKDTKHSNVYLSKDFFTPGRKF